MKRVGPISKVFLGTDVSSLHIQKLSQGFPIQGGGGDVPVWFGRAFLRIRLSCCDTATNDFNMRIELALGTQLFQSMFKSQMLLAAAATPLSEWNSWQKIIHIIGQTAAAASYFTMTTGWQLLLKSFEFLFILFIYWVFIEITMMDQ